MQLLAQMEGLSFVLLSLVALLSGASGGHTSRDKRYFSELDDWRWPQEAEKRLTDESVYRVKRQSKSCRSKVDIVFVVDSSGSIRQQNSTDGSHDNWNLMLQFIIGLVQQLDIGHDASRVGLVGFSDQAWNGFYLNDYYSKKELIDQIGATPYVGNNTNTSGGLRVMLQQQFIASRGDRPTINNVGIVITDGQSNRDTALLAPAALDAEKKNIKMLAIGITNAVNTTELANISSYPHRVNENWWTQPNFTTVNKILGQVSTAVCIMAEAPTPTGCDAEADVVFAVDASGSINELNPGNWQLVLQFLQRLAGYIASKTNTTRIGLSRFSDTGDIIGSLKDFGDLLNFINVINRTEYIGGFTNTADGLRSAQDIFSQDRRAGVKRILIIITDGKPTLNIGQEVPVAETIRKDGIRIVALGVTDSIDQDTLNALTGDPQLVVRSENFEALPGIIAPLLNVACAPQSVPTMPCDGSRTVFILIIVIMLLCLAVVIIIPCLAILMCRQKRKPKRKNGQTQTNIDPDSYEIPSRYHSYEGLKDT